MKPPTTEQAYNLPKGFKMDGISIVGACTFIVLMGLLVYFNITG